MPDRVLSELSGGEADEGFVFDCESGEGAVAVADEGSVGEEFVLVAGQVDDPAVREVGLPISIQQWNCSV